MDDSSNASKRLLMNPDTPDVIAAAALRSGNASSIASVNVDVDASPISILDTPSPPNKRQKTPHRLFPSLKNRSNVSLLEYLLDDSLTSLIFSFAGPSDTAKCAQVCRAWNTASRQHPSLWKKFAQKDFGLSNTITKNHQPWSMIYAYLAQQHPQTLIRHLDAHVLFADDGGNFPGYPAQHALLPSKSMVWCTTTGADQNVDLVIRLKEVSLITSFYAANGGRGYSAPLKEALVFCSIYPPDLDAARVYNIDEEKAMGSQWVQHLFQTENNSNTSSNVNNDARLHLPTAANNNLPQDGEAPPNHAEVHQPLERPVQAAPIAADATTVQTTTATTPKTTRPSSPALTSPVNAPVPVAAFHFPDLAQAYHAESEQTLHKPVLARYVHFKLLRSHSPPGLEHISDNIDVMALHTKGIQVEQLQDMVEVFPTEQKIPEYTRQHQIRRPINPLLLDAVDGPWLDAEFF